MWFHRMQVVGVVVVGGVAGGFRTWLFQSAAERVMFKLRVDLFASLLGQEIGFYDEVRIGEGSMKLTCLQSESREYCI